MDWVFSSPSVQTKNLGFVLDDDDDTLTGGSLAVACTHANVTISGEAVTSAAWTDEDGVAYAAGLAISFTVTVADGVSGPDLALIQVDVTSAGGQQVSVEKRIHLKNRLPVE